MKTNTHLLNLITQILDARSKEDDREEARLIEHAIADVVNKRPHTLRIDAVVQVAQMITFFTLPPLSNKVSP